MMRITGGDLKNKAVVLVKSAKHIRPTSSRVREAIFNILNHGKFLHELDVITEETPSIYKGRNVLDIYCGTGILGFEALSRGAGFVTFIDMDSQSIQIARDNAKNLGIKDKCKFIQYDSSKLPMAQMQYDLVMMDPPYNMGLVEKSLKSLADNGWVKKGGLVSVEHSKTEEVAGNERFQLLDIRLYNNSKLSFLKFLG